jgi:hypothetical protein
MNLLMILLIIAAIWICGAICFFAWRVMPDVEAPEQSSPADDSRQDS